ncbi:hypothetical protein N7523_002043 [Penicillium sp. IBT 18751x]|nr:hypothetical protein N7523_002043 [Penicillium sp. IBT 18751x]
MVMFIIQALQQRLICAGIFVPRLLVIFATIVQLVFIKNGTQRIDPSYNMCEITIFEVVTQSVSILTACWPQLKPFLSWMQSNGLKTHDVEDPNPQSFKIKPLSQVRPESPELRFNGRDSLPLTRQDRILITTGWEVDSQSSQANTIIETAHYPTAVDSNGGG